MDRSSAAFARYEQLWRTSGRFADWAPHTDDSVDEVLQGFVGQDPQGRQAREGHRHMYGLGFHPSSDLFTAALDEVLERSSEVTGLKRRSGVYAGTIPRVPLHDALSGEVMYRAAPNVLTSEVEPNQFLILGTTQMVKVLADYSALITSTTFNAEMTVSPTDLLDGLAAVVQNRFVSELMPPTWEHKYMPEDMMGNQLWAFHNLITLPALFRFLILHELAHISLGHCTKIETSSGQVRNGYVHSSLVEDEEFSADTLAAFNFAAMLMSDAAELGEEVGEGYAMTIALNLIKFAGYLGLAEDLVVHGRLTGSAVWLRRVEACVTGLLAGGQFRDDVVAYQISMMPGFFEPIERRLRQYGVNQ